MRRVRSVRVSVPAAVILLHTVSCALPPPPGHDQIVSALSELILRPAVSCEELRDSFGLDHLQPVDHPGQAGLVFEEHYVATPDGEWLRVWCLPADADRGTVLISPGAVGPMSCDLYPASLLVQAGWSVVIYEYRGFGGSTGSPSLAALPVDLEAVLDWARSRTGRERLSLLGTSLGSVPSAAIAIRRPDAVNAVVFDSPVALGPEIRRFREVLGIHTEAVVRSLDQELRTEEVIGGLRAPLLVFLHEADVVTSATNVEMIYDRAAGLKWLVRFPELDHARGAYLCTDEFIAALDAFLSVVWEH